MKSGQIMWGFIIVVAVAIGMLAGQVAPSSADDNGVCQLTARTQANQRSMATRSSHYTHVLERGDVVQANAKVMGRDGFIWWQLTDTSFVRSDMVIATESCGQLPEIIPSYVQYDIYGNEATLQNTLLITIDDCSIEENVRWVFDLLNNRGIKATFFPILRHVRQQDPQLWRDIVNAGFEIGYHTTMHIPNMSYDDLVADFAIFRDEMRQIVGNPDLQVRIVRAPAGQSDADWLQWSSDHQLYNIRWNVIMPMSIGRIIESAEHPRMGGILLFHTDREDIQWIQDHLDRLLALQTADNVPYRISTVSQALSD